ncbi:FAD-dependent oxidoreductase [Pseudonocardia sp. ICBG1293]|uniref:FAD-dependent oxidoreductase n=1 Tax=Pseudonocardia sp. ICBG1293 TaxID=2844382 RepID=UPI001CCE1D65|nr:FAD-dependent oxidoreductase [Pseudonocardia sp. ICBG1293]
MSPETITVDYLIIGAGATGMAFADALVGESDHTMAVVDRNHAPGGHWTLSYPFVRLHGPSNVYGVHSRAMPSDSIGASLASRNEILDYYDRIMRDVLLASGRVTYLPMHDVAGAGDGPPGTARATSLVNGATTEIIVRKRVVDASYVNVTVPAMKRPGYTVGDGVQVVPVNQLVELGGVPERFTVVGAGKTGLDACLWLLSQGVDPDRIRWIAPRDAWLVNRSHEGAVSQFRELTYLHGHDSADAAIGALEELGLVLRRDPSVTPGAFRCATVSSTELDRLRGIENVVRLGRVRRMDSTGVHLEGGSITTPPGTVYVDCSADGLTQKPTRPVFAENVITLQPLLPCLVAPSAAVVGKLESLDLDDVARNALAPPAQNPRTARDLLSFYGTRMERLHRWSGSPELFDWLRGSRLSAGLFDLQEMTDPDNRATAAALAAHLDDVLKRDDVTV